MVNDKIDKKIPRVERHAVLKPKYKFFVRQCRGTEAVYRYREVNATKYYGKLSFIC